MEKQKIFFISLWIFLIISLSSMAEFLVMGSFFLWISIGLASLLLFIIMVPDFLSFDLTSEKNTHLQKLQALGELSSSIAHDFNNILTVIVGNSDLIIEKYKNGSTDIQEEVGQIKDNAVRGSHLIKQLLSFGRKCSFSPIYCNVANIIQDLVPLLERLLTPRHHLLITNLDKSEEAIAYADPIQLEQIIINLVTNARDAMHNGGRIEITTALKHMNMSDINNIKDLYFIPPSSQKILPKTYVEIKVQDHGTGIAESILPQIFAPFFSTKDREGTGLGLATVFQLVQKLSGHILVRSRENHGTSFLLLLEQAVGEVEGKSHSLLSDISDVQLNEVTKYNILVVEDEEPVRKIVTFALRAAHFNVVEAKNGQDALMMLNNSKMNIDLLLTDLNLGALNGLEIATKIKECYPDIKVVITSGYGKHALDNHPEANEYVFLSKPYSPQELVHCIQIALSQK